jgi:ribonuclease HI
MPNWRCVVWNANNISPCNAPTIAHNFIDMHKTQVIMLQEFGNLSVDACTECFPSYVAFGIGAHSHEASQGTANPVTLLHTSLAKASNWECYTPHACLVQCRVGDIEILFANLHLPDSTKCTRIGVSFDTVLDEISLLLEARWLTVPWNILILGGDFNVDLPRAVSTGGFCTGTSLGNRESAVACFVNKWHLEWTSSFIDCEPSERYTHIHYTTKTARVIDYVCTSVTSNTPAKIVASIDHTCSVVSDHYPIFFDIQLHKKMPKKRWAPKLNLDRSTDLKNRFSALCEDIDGNTAENLQEGLKCVVQKLGEERRWSPAPAQPPHLNDLLKNEHEAYAQADSLEAKKAALKTINQKKKHILKQRADDKFDKCCLSAPRLDKSKSPGIIFPIEVEGRKTYNVQEWSEAFCSYYTSLFADPTNTFECQEQFLAELRSEMAATDRIVIPLFVLRDALSRGRQRSNTAPGADNLTWHVLAHLPDKFLLRLLCAFESRINGDAEHIEVIRDWAQFVVCLIPKTRSPYKVNMWRPISLVSCMQKLYMATVTHLVEHSTHPVGESQLGFSAGHQTAEISEFVRLAMKKATQWGVGFVALKLDASRAFDSMSHRGIADCLRSGGCPLRLVHAVLLEFHRNHMSLRCQGFDLGQVPFCKGGRQGGTDTPEWWKRYLDTPIRLAKARWDAEGLRARFPDALEGYGFDIDILAWADDMILFANTVADVKRMLWILGEEMKLCDLTFKSSSFEILKSGTLPWPVSTFTWELPGHGTFNIACKNVMHILGIAVDSEGSSLAAVEHRLTQGWSHFMHRSTQLCRRSVPLFKRWSRLKETVYRTVLFGSGAWELSHGLLSKLQTFENKVLLMTMARQPQPGESEGDFLHRQHIRLNFLRDSCGWVSLPILALESQLCWWGHVARMPKCPVKDIMFWRDLAWYQKIKHSKNRPKMSSRANFKAPEQFIVDCLGGDWLDVSRDRIAWRAKRKTALWEFVSNSVNLRNYDCGSNYSLQHISSRMQAMSFGALMLLPLEMLIVSDNETLVRVVRGDIAVSRTDIHFPYVQRLRWNMYMLEHHWRCRKLSEAENILVHRSRSYNTLADDLANKVLDERVPCLMYRNPSADLYSGCRVVAFCDGASRGNPGLASAAAIVLAIPPRGDPQIMVWKALTLGIATSVRAEFEGACLCLDLLSEVVAASGLCVQPRR